ncbi:MAG: hypothetical protein ACLFWF_04090 [Alphaproteobacteria bacterium]
MANPAFKRSGDMNEPDGERRRYGSEPSGSGEFDAQSTADLITMRDRLLEECLDLENRAPGTGGERAPDPGPLREKIDEIHQELALRDLAERVGAGGRTFGEPPAAPRAAEPAEGTAPAGDAAPAGPGLAAHAAQKSLRILDAIEMRSRFMDELAQAAREQGRLDQAATFTLNAQKLDMERVEVLGRLTALGAEAPNTEE